MAHHVFWFLEGGLVFLEGAAELCQTPCNKVPEQNPKPPKVLAEDFDDGVKTAEQAVCSGTAVLPNLSHLDRLSPKILHARHLAAFGA